MLNVSSVEVDLAPSSQKCFAVICVVEGSVATVPVRTLLVSPDVGLDVLAVTISPLPLLCFEINSEFRVSVGARELEFLGLLHDASTEIGACVESCFDPET